MKKIKMLLLFISLLSGCGVSNQNTSLTLEEESQIVDYDMVKEKHIEWSQLLSISQETYSCYVYSPQCGHCNEIKIDIINYSLSKDNFYFIKYDNSIPIITDIESTIGNNLEEIGIKGTPSLLVVENGVLTKNIAGAKAILELI